MTSAQDTVTTSEKVVHTTSAGTQVVCETTELETPSSMPGNPPIRMSKSIYWITPRSGARLPDTYAKSSAAIAAAEDYDNELLKLHKPGRNKNKR